MKPYARSSIGGLILAVLLTVGSVAFAAAQDAPPWSPGSFPGNTPRGGGTPMGGPLHEMDADLVARHFIEEMIPHHDDAVTMADLALAQAEHAELRELAGAIKQVQTDEIALMRQWYRDWFGTEPQSNAVGGMHHGMGGHEATAIDGAVPFDRAFIEEMIPHHEMAVMMSTMALRWVDRPELRELLQAIIVSQSAEIVQMRGWYQAWYGGALPLAGGMPRMAAPSGQVGPRGPAMGAGPHMMGGHGPRFDPQGPIRGLTGEEVQQIRRGEGAGLARTAELNGLPGPRHVLDLASELGLMPNQQAQIEAIYEAMQREALQLGPRYLDAQQALEEGFRAGRTDGAMLAARHAEMAARRAELEMVHLRAHLATAELLTPDQITHYNTLRGYPAAR